MADTVTSPIADTKTFFGQALNARDEAVFAAIEILSRARLWRRKVRF